MVRARRLLALAILPLFPATGLAAAIAVLPPAVIGLPVLVVGLPGSGDIDDRIARAGGYRIGRSDPPVGRLVHSHDPAFLARLRAGGAVMLLDADALSNFLCGRNA